MADWGLALCGFGMAISDGMAAALVLLVSVVLGRLPLYLWSRQALREKRPADRPINLLIAALLAGSAPLPGFSARGLLLPRATPPLLPLGPFPPPAMLPWP